jgi:hypothetical protein
MSELMPSVPSVSEAWLLALEHTAEAADGRAVHVVSTVTEPGAEIVSVRRVLDDTLTASGSQSVETVGETIFPASLYSDPGLVWSPGSPGADEEKLDRAAHFLYDAYSEMLPLLLTAHGNRNGTYFARMITWPGKEAGGVNQLAARITRLRAEHAAGRATYNALDMDTAADANTDQDELRGIQVYAPTDRRIRGFPCLTHVDLTLHRGRLHAMAVYRHQYLVDKAYGNLLGLSWLMRFLCQQSGFSLGELVVHATLADTQGRARALALARRAREALGSDSASTMGPQS